jgi:hypothetical protein
MRFEMPYMTNRIDGDPEAADTEASEAMATS